MEKKRIWVLVSIIGILLVVIGISFALWQFFFQQETMNVVNSSCFKLHFEETDGITLQNSFPMSEREGMGLTPYTFTLENICNLDATYQINLEELTNDSKRLSNQYLRVSFNGREGRVLSSYEEVEPTISNADISHKLVTGVLKVGEKKEFDLRLWMDEDTPAIEEVMNASFQSKITVVAVPNDSIPEVVIAVGEENDAITVDISTVSNEKNEELIYFYQLNNDSEIQSEENTHTFNNLSDGKYKARGRAETVSGIILEEKELEVTIAYERVYVSSSGSDEVGNGSIENPYASLQLAYNKVKSGGEILLLSDITATETTTMDIENKEVTLRSHGEDVYSIYRDDNFTSQVLEIRNANTVTTSNIIFDGRGVISNASLIESHDSILSLNEGTTIQNNNNHGRFYAELNGSGALGGGLFLWDSTLNINGANILYNKAFAQDGKWSSGGGVAFYQGILNIYDGNISYNETGGSINNQNGGGFVIIDSNVHMTGGVISNNTAKKSGGGIFFEALSVDSTMVMKGGYISQNSVTGDESLSDEFNSGGGIFAHSASNLTANAKIIIQGGGIENNRAPRNPNMDTRNGAQIVDER